jgi:hypothetical protein
MRTESQNDRCRQVGMLAKAIMRLSNEHRRTAIPSLVRSMEDALVRDGESDTRIALPQSPDHGSIIENDMPELEL